MRADRGSAGCVWMSSTPFHTVVCLDMTLPSSMSGRGRLVDCGGNVSQAARALGIRRRSLQRKLAKRPVSR